MLVCELYFRMCKFNMKSQKQDSSYNIGNVVGMDYEENDECGPSYSYKNILIK